jgi:hypothetical protein
MQRQQQQMSITEATAKDTATTSVVYGVMSTDGVHPSFPNDVQASVARTPRSRLRPVAIFCWMYFVSNKDNLTVGHRLNNLSLLNGFRL